MLEKKKKKKKENSGELILLDLKSFLFRFQILCKILYWNIRILESIVTFLGKLRYRSCSI